MYLNIPINKNTQYYNNSLFKFIGTNMENKEFIFDEMNIPEYRYPLAIFMANTYESDFFRIFVEVHRKKIMEYAEKNAIELGKIYSERSILTYYALTPAEKQILK